MGKQFLITIDTEADNQWNTKQPSTTDNSKYLPRFQELCEKYGFKPVWLTTYEMALDPFYIEYMKEKQDKNLCEIGMHLHSWSTPPILELPNVTNKREYLIECPMDVMEEKIKNITDLITAQFGIPPTSHRSGRWTMDERYYKLLKKYGYDIDCSVTPLINWTDLPGKTGIPGSDYSTAPHLPYYKEGLMEIPMTIKRIHYINFKRVKTICSLLGEIRRFFWGRNVWIRPESDLDFAGMKKVIDIANSNDEYIMFMIHSSELMPGGSPNFVSGESIEGLYELIEKTFAYIKGLGYNGATLKEYFAINRERIE